MTFPKTVTALAIVAILAPIPAASAQTLAQQRRPAAQGQLRAQRRLTIPQLQARLKALRQAHPELKDRPLRPLRRMLLRMKIRRAIRMRIRGGRF